MGVTIDSALTYQDEVKSILRKMACGIKTLYSLREVISDNCKVLTLNALVISHLHYSAVLLNGINNNLIRSIEKQLIWGVKACFHKKKYDSSLDLKIKHKNLPIRHFLDQKLLLHFWKIVSKKLPAYQMIEYPTLKLTKHERSKKIFFNIKTQSSYLENCVFKRGTIIYNKFAINEQYSQYLKNDHKCEKAKKNSKTKLFGIVFKEPKCSINIFFILERL